MESLRASLRTASEARERREADVKTELTRTKGQFEAEARRSSGLEKELGAARKDVAKAIRTLESVRAEAESAVKGQRERVAGPTAELTKARTPADQEQGGEVRL